MSDVYADRRARILGQLEDAALLVPAGPELRIGPDGEVRYVPDAELYWLTGFEEPGATLVLCPSADTPVTLFLRPRDPEREVWTGTRLGVEAAIERLGVDAAYAIGELDARVPELVATAAILHARVPSADPTFDALVLRVLAAGRARRPRKGTGAHTLRDPGLLLDGPRLRKDAHEIAQIRAAADITVDAFEEAITHIRPGAGEWEIEAALEGGFRRRGASGPSFPTIVAGGGHAATLHYTANAAPLEAGTLVLLDAGARHAMYCADISRTLPVSGSFTPQQRDLYDIVLGAHAAAVAAVRPGATVEDVHTAAVDVLVAGMASAGLIPADATSASDAWKRFYPHRTSHWLGLDVHDVGGYVADGQPVRLEPGMVLTIEPGLYLPSDAGRASPSPRALGIRIEDDVLVTETGPEVLTGRLPVSPDDIVARMR